MCAMQTGSLRYDYLTYFTNIIYKQTYFTQKLLKVWSAVKICRTRVPRNAIVPVGRPRPYSIIILNMRFIPKAPLRASSRSQQVHIYLSDIYELIIQSPLPLPLIGRWLANKLTVLLRGCENGLTPSLY